MMISKKMGLSRLLPMLAIGGMFVFSGCDDSKDLYNPDRIQEEAKEAFPVKNIDPNQTWETSAVCNASVSVKETAGETYTIKVYTANPYNTNGDAALLAKTTVTNGQTVNFKFDIPAALQYVYVMKVNGEGYSSAVPAAVENGTVKVAFGEGSGTTRAAMTRGAITRANVWQPTAPDLNDSAIFPTDAPTGSYDYNNNWQINEGGNYIITETATGINCQQGANFFVKGNITLESIYCQGDLNLYILPGATLTMKDKFDYAGKATLSIGKGAMLKCNELNLSGSFGVVYNAGTIEAEDYLDSRNNHTPFYNLGIFKFNNTNLSNINFYNDGNITANKIDINNTTNFINATNGKITLTGRFSCENGSSIAVNEGEIVAASFGVAGSSSFYNYNKVIINGQSDIDSNNSTWDNEGYFKTTNIVFKASSPNWINRCQLYVTEKFTYTTNSVAGLIMDAGAYAECGSLYADQANIKMGNKAFFNVLGEAKFKHNPKGFIATGDEYALLKMGSAVQEDAKQGFSITYEGKLYVACDNHFAQGNDGSAEHPLFDIKKGAQITGADNADITIQASECNPGYNPTPGGGDDNVQTYAYAFEDMMKDVGDYDFNDVVLYVTVPYENGGKKFIDVTLKAAGASKQLAVGFKNNGTPRTIFASVHESLGVPVGTIVNTGDATGTTKTETIEVGDDFSLTNDGDFYISDGKREIHIPNFTSGFNTGDVPYAIRIASSWKWPKERVLITEAYTGFATWAQDATSEPNWYNNSEGGKVMD